MGAISGGLKLAYLAVIVGIGWFMYGMANDARDAHWQPIYEDLNHRYNQVNTDLRILKAESKGAAEKNKGNLALIGVKTEVDHVTRKAEIKAEADRYLNNLFIASSGVLGTPQDEDSLYTGTDPRRSLSRLAKSLPDSCTGKVGLYHDLRQLDRTIAEEILIPCNLAREELRDLKSYVLVVEAEMDALKQQNNINEGLIEDTQ